jgi:hypothetical protein
MTTVDITDVKIEGCEAKASCDGSILSVQMLGNWDMSGIGPLGAFLTSLQSEVIRLHLPEVVVHFDRVEFMNSSCFKSFVKWVSSLRQLEADKRYKIKFRTNTSLQWQRRSLEALRCFAKTHVTIDD